MPVSPPPKATYSWMKRIPMPQIAVHWVPRDLRYAAPGWVHE